MQSEDVVRTARLFRLMGNPTRIALLRHLSETDATLGELSKALNRSKSSLCMNLGDLSKAGLVEKKGTGADTSYSLRSREVLEVLSFCCDLCKSLEKERG